MCIWIVEGRVPVTGMLAGMSLCKPGMNLSTPGMNLLKPEKKHNNHVVIIYKTHITARQLAKLQKPIFPEYVTIVQLKNITINDKKCWVKPFARQRVQTGNIVYAQPWRANVLLNCKKLCNLFNLPVKFKAPVCQINPLNISENLCYVTYGTSALSM